ncbi:MAG: hypothetical protein Q9219_005408 [cf. Caloplaca sp. 3 TL-2023]
MTIREATHAGSWYTEDGPTLSRQLQGWLNLVPSSIDGVGKIPQPGARIIIAPHAGYSYSGPAAAWAYKCLDLSKCKRIFLLGPSHHLYLPNCALTQCTTYSTPLGPLPLDTTILAALRSTSEFSPLPLHADEAEHSLEMHLPYIRHLLSSYSFPSSNSSKAENYPLLIPILVGSTSPAAEKSYGELLAPYLADEENVFIVSSDFCHWGSRFQYTYYLPSTATSLDQGITLPSGRKNKVSPPTDPPIHKSIERVDRMCMDAVEEGTHDGFLDVLKETGNTVCGRHPIGVVMAALEVLLEREEKKKERGGVGGRRGRFKFVRYERSGEVKAVGESSVSYASAFAVL